MPDAYNEPSFLSDQLVSRIFKLNFWMTWHMSTYSLTMKIFNLIVFWFVHLVAGGVFSVFILVLTTRFRSGVDQEFAYVRKVVSVSTEY